MPQQPPPAGVPGSAARRGLWVAAAILLAGCSGGFDRYFGSDKAPPKPPEPKTATEQATDAAQEVPGAEQEYPNLGSVPQTKPIRQSPPAQTQAIAKGLVADRQNARYTDEVIRRDPVQAASAPRTAPAAPPKLPAAPAVPPPAAAPAPAAAPPALPRPATPPTAMTAEAAQPPVLPAPQPAPAPSQPMLLGTQVAQAIQDPPPAPQPAQAAPLPQPAQPGTATIDQPPAVAPAPQPSMASVAQPQFQPPPPPVIPGQGTQAAPPAPQPAPQQIAALPPASPPPAAQRPVLTPPPGYGLPPAASALAPPPTAPYVPTAAPVQGQPAVLNPIRPPPPPISPALPAMGARPAAGVPMSEAAAIAEARRRAAFSPGQQVGLILFEHGSASLAPADRTLLQRIAVLARQNGAVVRVVGHASGRTGEMDGVRHLNRNLNISEARATAAAAELNAAGLPAERIVIEAKGDSEPIYSEAMPSGEAGNRRVEVYLQ